MPPAAEPVGLAGLVVSSASPQAVKARVRGRARLARVKRKDRLMGLLLGNVSQGARGPKDSAAPECGVGLVNRRSLPGRPIRAKP